MLWSILDWRARKSFLAAFGLTLLLLIGSAELLLPGWLGLWRESSKSYLAYVRPSLLGSLWDQLQESQQAAPLFWSLLSCSGVSGGMAQARSTSTF
jgi:hypothetical protein